MSRMKEKPFIINGGGSDVIFTKTDNNHQDSEASYTASDNRNANLPSTKYSLIPEVKSLF